MYKNWDPFIAYYESYSQALSRHIDSIAIDNQVYIYSWRFANYVNPWRLKQTL